MTASAAKRRSPARRNREELADHGHADHGQQEQRRHHDPEAPVCLLARNPGVRAVEPDNQCGDQEDRGDDCDIALNAVAAVAGCLDALVVQEVEGSPKRVAELSEVAEGLVDPAIDRLHGFVVGRRQPRLAQVMLQAGDVRGVSPSRSRARAPERSSGVVHRKVAPRSGRKSFSSIFECRVRKMVLLL